MARLQTGSFDLRHLPLLQALDAREFSGAPQAAAAGFGDTLRQLGSIEELRTAQRAGDIAAATQDARKRIALLQGQIGELEGGEAVATHEQQARLRALKNELAQMQTAGSITAEPEIQQIEGLKRGEMVETFPEQRARREAETTRGTATARAGTETEEQRRAGLEATRDENLRVTQTAAEAARIRNQTDADQERAAGFAARYASEPKLTHIIEDDTGTYRETYVQMGDRKVVLSREQVETPSQRTSKTQQATATLKATEALANQRNRISSQKPIPVRDRHGATTSFGIPHFNQETGELESIEYVPSTSQAATARPTTTLPATADVTGRSTATAAPVAPTSKPAAHVPNAKQIALLQTQPELAPQFDAMFGEGAAARVLGGQ